MRKLFPFIMLLSADGCSTQVNIPQPGTIVLEVWKNQQLVTRAGADDLGVLDVIVDALGPLGKKSVRRCTEQCCSKEPELFLSAGGLTSRQDPSSDEFQNWIELEKLKVGDAIEIKIRNDVDPYPVKTSRKRLDLSVQKFK